MTDAVAALPTGASAPLPAVYLHAPGVICALGRGRAQVAEALFAAVPGGVAPRDGFGNGPLPVGAVTAPLASTDALPPEHRSRNNALLLTALEELRPSVDAAIARFGVDRVGVVLGTSTSGIGESEQAMLERASTGHLSAAFHLGQQELGSSARALSGLLGLGGPSLVISTACSSSAKALASAARLLRAGLCDAVIAGGADSLCRFTVAGFSALDSVSRERSNPLSDHRDGINIGEGAALFLLTREASLGPELAPAAVRLCGAGESSDAHHLSAPDPRGLGALTAMREALARAGVRPDEVGYLNLHGTATRQNDAMEGVAVQALLGGSIPCSSTKPLTGHTLGACGAIEAAFCWLTLTDVEGRLPPHWWDGEVDPQLPPLHLVAPGQRAARPLRYALSNAFAFGGSNASLLLGLEAAP